MRGGRWGGGAGGEQEHSVLLAKQAKRRVALARGEGVLAGKGGRVGGGEPERQRVANEVCKCEALASEG